VLEVVVGVVLVVRLQVRVLEVVARAGRLFRGCQSFKESPSRTQSEHSEVEDRLGQIRALEVETQH
jgi:hypothetical protein